MDDSTTRARLVCDETAARRLAAYLGESLDPENTACAAFEIDGQWQVTVHFREPPDQAAVRALAAISAGDAAAAAISFEQVATRDWVASSLEGLAPVNAGRFVVHGAHDRARIAPHRIGIEIEAALAFGTGHHGTTRGCLLALDDIAKRTRAHNVLDLGTGSGVLAIAAARIFHSPVLATDIDGVALTAAKANARLNRAASRITFVCATGCGAHAIAAKAPYDLIFANILLPVLVRMAAPLSRLAAPGGRIVLSGLLRGQANAALAIYRAQGLALERRIPLDEWVTLVLKRKRPGRGSPGRFLR
jgi:ribosomal protein L11 methyltransferase